MPSATKLCPRCNQTFSRAEFGKRSYCKPCHNDWQKEYYAKDKRRARVAVARSTYGLTEEQLIALEDSHQGLCGICNRPCPANNNLSIDHCHETGKVRGLLCRRCNSGLGMFDDSPEFLRLAALYLESR